MKERVLMIREKSTEKIHMNVVINRIFSFNV